MKQGLIEQLQRLSHRAGRHEARSRRSSSDDGAEALCTLAARTHPAKGAAAAAAAGDVPAPHDEKAIQEAKSKLFNVAAVRQYMGADVLSLLSVPVFIMEPSSMLQKMAEIMEYTDLLDSAAAAGDPLERMALVAAFLMTPFGACERAWKPFNPLLGETFEMEGLGPLGDGRFFAEQVTHHPPVSAAHAESPRWRYDIVSAPKTRFLGNALDVFPNGRTRVALPGRGEVYTHLPPRVKVHSLVLGRTWIDVEGEFYVYCPESGAKCVLNFTPCGWLNAGRYEFSGYVTDSSGARRLKLSGLWCSHADVAACGPGGEDPAPGAAARRLWACAGKPAGDHYGLTHFARRLGTCAGLRAPPLPSDSRRRPDRAALGARHMARAAAEKARLEDAQRAERAHRERGSGGAWAPRWFDRRAEMALLPGELGLDQVPAYSWRDGNFPLLDARPAAGGNAAGGVGAGGIEDAAVCGQGYAPWQYPHLHA